MRLQDAKAIIKEAKVRVCRHHPRLVLSATDLVVYESIQAGFNNPVSISENTGKKIEQVRNILSKLTKQGYLSRERQTPPFSNSQYVYSIVKWVPNAN